MPGDGGVTRRALLQGIEDMQGGTLAGGTMQKSGRGFKGILGLDLG